MIAKENLKEIFDARFQNLNPEQQEAVNTIEGPVLVVAGPGSGKTELLSLRVANILDKTDTPPTSILCLTYTDSGVKNMKKRLQSIIGPTAHDVHIHTFHSFCTEMMQKFSSFFYATQAPEHLNTIQAISILKSICDKLPLENPLGYSTQNKNLIKSLIKSIGNLKKFGLSPTDLKNILLQNNKFLDTANPLVEDFFSQRMSPKIVDQVPLFIEKIRNIPVEELATSVHFTTYKDKLSEILNETLQACYQTEKASPLSDFKTKHTYLDSNKARKLKDSKNIKKLISLSEVYEKYEQEKTRQNLIDFDDMIINFLNVCKKNPELKYNLQENFLYVLVDEFQDTSNIQTEILDLLIDNEVNEGNPNIMTVGDDDQAIYKFQGASIDNILEFKKNLPTSKIITLTKNYRSTTQILEFIKPIINQGQQRLENLLPEVQKDLISAKSPEIKGEIIEICHDLETDENIWIAEQIMQKIKQGTPPAEIAVLARKHKHLLELATIMGHFNIPIDYSKDENILENPIIVELTTILKFIEQINNNQLEEANQNLSQILKFEFWNLNTLDLWQIAKESYEKKQHWLDSLLEKKEPSTLLPALFLLELARLAISKEAIEILDILIGNQQLEINVNNENITYFSPFKSHHFPKQELGSPNYINLLTSLQTFFETIKNFHKKEKLTIKDLLEVFELYQQYDEPIKNSNNIAKEVHGVKLMTAHSAKGLEFENVFILKSTESSWGKSRKPQSISFPLNLKIDPEDENDDDRLRLLFVALSRAKTNLYISHSQYSNQNKELIKNKFLSNPSQKNTHKTPENLEKILEIQTFGSQNNKIKDFNHNEKSFLKNLTTNYKLSPTDLDKFIDLEYGGPQTFLETSILRFPQAKNANMSYGTAIHSALEFTQKEVELKKQLPQIPQILDVFERNLKSAIRDPQDFQKYLEKGSTKLKNYITKHATEFEVGDKSELNFRNHDIFIGTAPITGRIDKIKIDEAQKIITVLDYKTGKCIKSFTESTTKALKMKHQLIFYKILIENSRDYKDKYSVNQGTICFIDAKEDETDQIHHFITAEEVNDLKKLIEAVSKKIQTLDFPDISNYDKDINGTHLFIQDLIHGNV